MKGLILCGGLSTRLGEITKAVPKVLLDVGGKTVLQHQVAMMREAGVDELYLASGHLHDVLEKEVGASLDGMPIHYVREHKKLGTGGAIKNALNAIQSYPVLVLNGDILLDAPLSEMVRASVEGMSGMLLGVEVPDARSYGRLLYDEESNLIEQFVEKDPNHEGAGVINGGVYLLHEGFAQYFPDEEAFSIEYDVFPKVKELYVFHYKGTWIDIGTPERLQFAREHLTF